MKGSLLSFNELNGVIKFNSIVTGSRDKREDIPDPDSIGYRQERASFLLLNPGQMDMI
jgi:hypothetical protein